MTYDINSPEFRELLEGLDLEADEPEPADRRDMADPTPQWAGWPPRRTPRPSRHYEPEPGDIAWLNTQPTDAAPARRRGRWGSA